MGDYDRHYQREREQLLARSTHCAICGGPLYPNLRFPHPLSSTADHIRELAMGGGHRGNLRPAHLRCNSSRGARNGNRRRGTASNSGPQPSRDW